MLNDNNNVDSSLLVAGAGILRKQVRSVIEMILPCSGVPLQDWVTFVRKVGGPLVFAKLVAGDDNVSLLRAWLKRQRQQVNNTDYEGKLGFLPAIVYGQVNNLIAAREADAKDNGLSDAFKAVFETSIARKAYGADAESHLQPDFDRMVEYTDAAPKNRGLYLGRFCVDFFRKGKRPSGLVQVDSGSIRGWVLDIRHSADFNNPSIFTPVTKLGIGMMVYEMGSVKEFIDRFYNEPSRLIWRKIGYGAKKRWSVWMPSPKSGWIWSPLTYRSSRKVDRLVDGNGKYARKVYVKGDRWISARKSGEDALKVTVYQAVIKEVTIPSKLLPELSYARGEDVFSEPCVEKRKVIKKLKEAVMVPQEWGKKVKELIANGWICQEILPMSQDKARKDWCDRTLLKLRNKRKQERILQLLQLPEMY